MNKNAIKKFATDARRELISRVGQRALKYGISDKEIGNPKDDSVNGHLLSSTEKKQRAALIEQIKEKGYEQVMEEVAYTWFNRFSALRFMHQLVVRFSILFQIADIGSSDIYMTKARYIHGQPSYK